MKKLALTAMAFGAILSACGDDITEVEAVKVLSAGEALGECNSKNDLEVVFVTDSAGVYYCAEGKWLSMKGADGKEGASGPGGKEGPQGKDGYSCSVTQDAKKGLTTITCDSESGKVSYDVKNGTLDQDVVGCTVNRDADRNIVITCGENPQTQEIIYFCGNQIYFPEEQVCHGGVLFDKCGKNGYVDPQTQMCFEKCGTDGYVAPLTQYCGDDNKIHEMCGSVKIDEASQFCDRRNDKAYNFIQIGNQVWMAENLNTENGYSVPDGTEYLINGQPPQTVENYSDTYGKLYTSAEAMYACPTGWHLPSYEEVLEMFDAAGGYSDESAQKLKSTEGWDSPYINGEFVNGNGTNEFGFNALPAGRYGSSAGKFLTPSFGDTAFFWLSSKMGNGVNAVFALTSSPYRNKGQGPVTFPTKENGDKMSVRCILGESPVINAVSPTSVTSGNFVDDRDGRPYTTVKIGDQTWMAENLAYNIGEYCYSDVNCRYTLDDVKKACPAGWHLPSQREWMTLFNSVGGASVASLNLVGNPNNSLSNSYGFSATDVEFWSLEPDAKASDRLVFVSFASYMGMSYFNIHENEENEYTFARCVK